jgi:hypothetical protein
MNLRVISEGKTLGTKVQQEDGSDIHGVRSVKFSHKAGDIPLIEVEIVSAGIDVKGRARFLVADPRDGNVKKEVALIIFADGSEWRPDAQVQDVTSLSDAYKQAI